MTDTTDVTTSEASTTQEEMVSKAELNKVLDDMMAHKKRARELEDKVKSYEQQVREVEEKRLVEKEDYKNLYEQWREKASKAEKEKSSLLKAFESDKKFEVIKRAAVKNGLRDEAMDDLEYLDTSNVIVEKTDQGRINIIGADEFVINLKERKPYWFRDAKPARVNTSDGNPGRRPGDLTPAEIIKLQKEKPEEYKKVMAQRLG